MLKPECRKEGYIGHIFVDEAWRNKKVGSALMHYALTHLAKQQCTRIRTHTDTGTFGFFEKFGFKPRGVELQMSFREFESRSDV